MDPAPVRQGPVSFALCACPRIINVAKAAFSYSGNLNGDYLAMAVIYFLNVANRRHWDAIRTPTACSMLAAIAY